jgi:hypothetical protein
LTLAIAYSSDEKAAAQVIDSEGVRGVVKNFEQCLMYFSSHIKGIVGLSNVLLGFYEKKVELGRRVDDGKQKEEAQERAKSSAIKESSRTPANMQASSEHRQSSATNATPPGSTSGQQPSN